jgi:hypothetical protein
MPGSSRPPCPPESDRWGVSAHEMPGPSYYHIDCPATGDTWAMKCFMREVLGLEGRHRRIAEHPQLAGLPFAVDSRRLSQRASHPRPVSGWRGQLCFEWLDGTRQSRPQRILAGQFLTEVTESGAKHVQVGMASRHRPPRLSRPTSHEKCLEWDTSSYLPILTAHLWRVGEKPSDSYEIGGTGGSG